MGAESVKRENEPKDGALYQQRMKAWYPILHPVWVIVTLFIIGIVFIPVGLRLKAISDDVVEFSHMYDSGTESESNRECAISEANQGRECLLTFVVVSDMEPPIMVYYQIENFYQNHRRYYSSRDDAQLLGRPEKQTEVARKACEPLNTLKNMNNETIILNPCGLTANTLFNDVISLDSALDSAGDQLGLVMLEDGIAWQSDLEYKFDQPDGFIFEEIDKADCPEDCDNKCACNSTGRLPKGSPICTEGKMYNDTEGTCYRYFYPDDSKTQYLHETYPKVVSPIEGVKNEHFIVWMRNAALPKFRKLYGFIDKKINAGSNITFKVDANWVVHTFKGSKTLVLTTTSTFGGKNPSLGFYFIGVGIFCLVCAMFFGLKHYLRPRKLADTKYLKYKEE